MSNMDADALKPNSFSSSFPVHANIPSHQLHTHSHTHTHAFDAAYGQNFSWF